MKKRNKTYLRIGVVLLVLIVIARTCNYFLTEDILRTPFGIFLGMLRSYIYIGIFLAWGFSLQQRISWKKLQRYLVAIAALLVLWMLFRTIKYYFVADVNVERFLWYCFYIPMLFIPLFAALTADALGRFEQHRRREHSVLLAVTTLLVLLVLTNDLHQLVFRFPKDAVVFTEDVYYYAPGYFLVFGWIILCVVWALLTMLSKCRIRESREVLWLPFIPAGIAMVYAICYAGKVMLVRRVFSDMTVFQCFSFAACFECCIACGLIPSNTRYRELFSAMTLPVYITDRQLRLRAASRAAGSLPKEALQENADWPLMLNKNERLSRSDIRGGYVFWKDNVSGISGMIAELQELNKTLSERHTLIREENRTIREKERLLAANRIYQRMQMETEPQLEKMQQLITEISGEENPEREKRLLVELAMLGAYFKRRNNLLFVSETQESIRMEELGYCISESLSALELRGAHGSCRLLGEGELPLAVGIRIYDAFQLALQEIFLCADTIAALIREKEEGYELCLSLHVEQEGEFHFAPCFAVEWEEDRECTLTGIFRREEKA